MDSTGANCPFCHPDNVLFGNESAYVIADAHPVNPGHLLIIPRRHVADFFETSPEEKRALLSLLDEAKQYLETKYTADGYNMGVNVGEVAGQTVMHVHIHLIPRYRGDTPQPRGGVRGVIPARQNY